jgi:hypothetical protein
VRVVPTFYLQTIDQGSAADPHPLQLPQLRILRRHPLQVRQQGRQSLPAGHPGSCSNASDSRANGHCAEHVGGGGLRGVQGQDEVWLRREGLLRSDHCLPHVPRPLHVGLQLRLTFHPHRFGPLYTIPAVQPGQPPLHKGLSQLSR